MPNHQDGGGVKRLFKVLRQGVQVVVRLVEPLVAGAEGALRAAGARVAGQFKHRGAQRRGAAAHRGGRPAGLLRLQRQVLAGPHRVAARGALLREPGAHFGLFVLEGPLAQATTACDLGLPRAVQRLGATAAGRGDNGGVSCGRNNQLHPHATAPMQGGVPHLKLWAPQGGRRSIYDTDRRETRPLHRPWSGASLAPPFPPSARSTAPAGEPIPPSNCIKPSTAEYAGATTTCMVAAALLPAVRAHLPVQQYAQRNACTPASRAAPRRRRRRRRCRLLPATSPCPSSIRLHCRHPQ